MTAASTEQLSRRMPSLPTEILRMIFRHTMISSEEDGVLASPDLTAIAISATCRLFRNIALTFPDLWSHINLLWQQPVIDIFLERAGVDSLVSVYHCAREAVETANNSDGDDEFLASAASAGSESSVRERSRSLSATSSSHDRAMSRSASVEAPPPGIQRLTPGLFARVQRLQLDERKPPANAALIMMYAQTALRQAQTLAFLESFTLLCDDFTNIHFAETHDFQRLKFLSLSDVIVRAHSRLFAPTMTSLVLRGVVLVGGAASPLLHVIARMPLLKRLEVKALSASVNLPSTEDIAAVELRHLRYLAIELEADATLVLLEKIHHPTDTELLCKFSGAIRMLVNDPVGEREQALPLRIRVARLLSAIRAQYRPALDVPGNSFSKISITSAGQFDGCRITLEKPTDVAHRALHLPERVILQLMDANPGPPSHVDVSKLVAHVIPLLPSPESGYTTLVVGPVPWAREHADWSSGLAAALPSIIAADVAGIAGEGLLAAMYSDSSNTLFPQLLSLYIRHLNLGAVQRRIQVVKEKRPGLDIEVTSVLF